MMNGFMILLYPLPRDNVERRRPLFRNQSFLSEGVVGQKLTGLDALSKSDVHLVVGSCREPPSREPGQKD